MQMCLVRCLSRDLTLEVNFRWMESINPWKDTEPAVKAWWKHKERRPFWPLSRWHWRFNTKAVHVWVTCNRLTFEITVGRHRYDKPSSYVFYGFWGGRFIRRNWSTQKFIQWTLYLMCTSNDWGIRFWTVLCGEKIGMLQNFDGNRTASQHFTVSWFLGLPCPRVSVYAGYSSSFLFIMGYIGYGFAFGLVCDRWKFNGCLGVHEVNNLFLNEI